MRYVLIPKFCDMTGYTEKAVRRKIETGVWLEGQQWRRAPDGHVLVDRDNIPAEEPAWEPGPECGVYMLLTAETVVYVGRSTTLRNRLATHRRSGRAFEEVRVIPCDEVTAVWLEKELIRTLNPTQNLLRYIRHAAATAKVLTGGGLQ